MVASESGVLEEAVGLNEGLERLGRDEVVVYTVCFAGAGPAGRAGDGEAEGVWVAGKEELVESSFSDT